MARKIFHEKIKVSSSKNDRVIKEKPFPHSSRSLYLHNSASEASNASKFREICVNYVSTDPESFIQLSQKTPGIFMFLQTTYNDEKTNLLQLI